MTKKRIGIFTAKGKIREHTFDKPCPVTGKLIPENFVWTNHKKAGLFNACYACDNSLAPGENTFTLLQKLQEKREKEST